MFKSLKRLLTGRRVPGPFEGTVDEKPSRSPEQIRAEIDQQQRMQERAKAENERRDNEEAILNLENAAKATHGIESAIDEGNADAEEHAKQVEKMLDNIQRGRKP